MATAEYDSETGAAAMRCLFRQFHYSDPSTIERERKSNYQFVQILNKLLKIRRLKTVAGQHIVFYF
jgi:hypothetical protein